MLASRRFTIIRNLTLPMKAFLATSSGTFVGIISADRASRDFEFKHNQNLKWLENREERLREEESSHLDFTHRTMAWARREKYNIVGTTWLASMIGSFILVGRNPYLSNQQKIVQARVYAQGLTLAVLVASAAFELSERRKDKIKAHKAPGDDRYVAIASHQQEQQDLWKDIVAAEEDRMKKEHQPLYHHPENDTEDENQSIAPRECRITYGLLSSPVRCLDE